MSVLCQAKLRYDPIELDPEDMCRMASEQPQVRIHLAFKGATSQTAHLEKVGEFFHVFACNLSLSSSIVTIHV